MSRACQAIGLAESVKQTPIGPYVQDPVDPPGPAANGPYIGTNGSTYYVSNVLDQDVATVGGWLVPSNDGVAAGHNARWVTNTTTIAADTTKCDVSATGVATANNSTGIYACFCGAKGIPANSFFFVFL